jgi:hypothetical protein
MNIENLEEEGMEKKKNMEIELWKLMMSLKENSGDEKIKYKIMEEIIEESMEKFYEEV